jgi:hypothetical protein
MDFTSSPSLDFPVEIGKQFPAVGKTLRTGKVAAESLYPNHRAASFTSKARLRDARAPAPGVETRMFRTSSIPPARALRHPLAQPADRVRPLLSRVAPLPMLPAWVTSAMREPPQDERLPAWTSDDASLPREALPATAPEDLSCRAR